jgi:hypothetical protein
MELCDSVAALGCTAELSVHRISLETSLTRPLPVTLAQFLTGGKVTLGGLERWFSPRGQDLAFLLSCIGLVRPSSSADIKQNKTKQNLHSSYRFVWTLVPEKKHRTEFLLTGHVWTALLALGITTLGVKHHKDYTSV